MRQLSQARDFQDMVRIRTKFMQDQFKEFGEQTKGPLRAAFETSLE
jgi:hypothetical protein